MKIFEKNNFLKIPEFVCIYIKSNPLLFKITALATGALSLFALYYIGTTLKGKVSLPVLLCPKELRKEMQTTEEYKIKFDQWLEGLRNQLRSESWFNEPIDGPIFDNQANFFKKLFFEPEALKKDLMYSIQEQWAIAQFWEDNTYNAGVSEEYIRSISKSSGFNELFDSEQDLKTLHNAKAHSLIEKASDNPKLIFLLRDIFMTAWIKNCI